MMNYRLKDKECDKTVKETMVLKHLTDSLAEKILRTSLYQDLGSAGFLASSSAIHVLPFA